MKFDRAKLKEEAKAKIKGKVFNLVLANIIVMILIAPVNFMLVFGQIIAIGLCVLQIGLSYFYLNFLDSNKIDYADLFFSFKFKDLNKYINHVGTVIVMVLLILLWSLLLIIPGIIKAMAYSQTLYIRAENPDKDIMSCLRESEKLMDGHKAEFFELMLSFIGWMILTGITFGIVGIYVLPYVSTTLVMYYRQLKDGVTEPIISKEPIIS